MAILKNKFYVGEPVYCSAEDEIIEVRKIFDNVENSKLIYGLSNDRRSSRFLIVDESVLYESKEAYEAEQNQIRVGDEYYLMVSSPCDIRKLKANEITEFFIDGISIKWCFKTKELLLQAVQKAVEECE